MKKLSNKQVENLKTGIIVVLGIIVFIGGIYIASENSGDRSLDKSQNNSGTTQQETSTDENPLLEEGEEITEEEQGELTSITYENLKSSLNKNEKKIVMLGTEWCGWCTYQKTILKYLVYKYNIEINYLNLENLSEDDKTDLANLHESLASFGTPTFIIIENGKVTVVETGARGTKSMIELLKNNGFINE